MSIGEIMEHVVIAVVALAAGYLARKYYEKRRDQGIPSICFDKRRRNPYGNRGRSKRDCAERIPEGQQEQTDKTMSGRARNR